MDAKRVLFTIAGSIAAVMFMIAITLAMHNKYRDSDNIVISAETVRQTSVTTESETTSVAQTTHITITPTSAVTAFVADTTAQTTDEASSEPEILYIDINHADFEELKKLNGIEDALAQAIIDYRNRYGEFRNIEEIMCVKGIGEGIFSNICGNIYVEYPVYEFPDDDISNEDNYEEEYYEELPPETEADTAPSLTLEDIAPININTASVEELVLLPYITEDIALEIIDLRERIHGFSHVYELLYVDEIERNKFAEIINFITVGQ